MPPSNTSSPLSEADADSTIVTDTDDDTDADIIIARPVPGGQLRAYIKRRRSRSARSATSSTIVLPPGPRRDDDSDLSELSDEEEQEQELENDGDGEDEDGDGDVEEQEPELEVPRSRLPSAGYRNPAGVATKASPGQRCVEFPHPKCYNTDSDRESGVKEPAYESDSDTNSLSPPPPSTGPKTQALPKVEPALQGSLLEEEDSELESLTDSNGDGPQEAEVAEAKDENRSESEQPDQVDEEEGDGDVTMRAGDLEVEVETAEKKEDAGEVVAGDTHIDESGVTGEQDVQAEEEAQPEEPVEEEVEEAPRKLDCRGFGTELTIQHHPPYQYSRSARTRRIPLHLPRLL